MERLVKFEKGDVVIFHFPFSDKDNFKKRPSLVVAVLKGDHIILAQITSAAVRSDEYAVLLETADFQVGKLSVSSLVRPNKLFTADVSIISSKIGTLKEDKIKEIENTLIRIFKG